LLQLPDVHGIGIGREGDHFFLGVLVDGSQGPSTLPLTIEGVPVKKLAGGPFRFLQSLPAQMGSSTSSDAFANLFLCDVGTLGFKVRDLTTPGVVGYVTNNHVAVGPEGNNPDLPDIGPCLMGLEFGFNQLHPGLADSDPPCTPEFIIGTLNRYISWNFDNYVPTSADAAFVTSDDSLTTREIGCGIGFPTSRIPSQEELLGQTVKKCGRTTGLTQNTVTMIFTDFVAITPFCRLRILFGDHVMVRSEDPELFADLGDSGAPVLTLSNDPVGIVVAQPRDPETEELLPLVALSPLDVILSELQLQLDDGSRITVVRPNGGENWAIESTQTIQWTSIGTTGNVRIELSRNGGGTFVTLFSNTANDGSQSWTVTGPASTNCRVRISALTGGASDISNTPFTITDTSSGSITVLTPNGSEVWPRNQSREIRWSSSGVSGNVKIELSRDGGRSWTTLFASTANDGSEFWQVTGPATRAALIRVSSVNNPSVQDRSDVVFTIQ
jgi:hypothetical protein